MELRGKPVADKIKADLAKKLEVLKKRGLLAKLVIVRLGEKPDDISYERSILNYCQDVGIDVEVVVRDRSISQEELIGLIGKLNQDSLVDGILIFRPLPDHLDGSIIASSVSECKDLDAMHPANLLDTFLAREPKYQPSTARAVMELLSHYNIKLTGKNIVVVNRSEVVGKPLAMMLLKEDATVSICHSKTENLKTITRDADIVVTAIGRPRHFDRSYFNPDSIVIDVGMGLDENNRLSGDLDYESVAPYVKHVTPVPGGVGRITTSVLLKQLIENINR